MTVYHRQAFDDHQAKVLAEATVQMEAYAMERLPRILAEHCGFVTESSVPETIYADDRGIEIDFVCRGTIAGRRAAVLCEVKTNITSHEVRVNCCWPLWWGRRRFLSLAHPAWMGGNPPSNANRDSASHSSANASSTATLACLASSPVIANTPRSHRHRSVAGVASLGRCRSTIADATARPTERRDHARGPRAMRFPASHLPLQHRPANSS
jgi:hypothetical protein